MTPIHSSGVPRSSLSGGRTKRVKPAGNLARWALAGVLCALLAAICPPSASGQSSARINGFVRDQSGAIIPAATVTLRDQDTGTALHGVTDGNGFYSFEAVLPKTYTLTVSMKGFKTYTSTGIVVHPADRLDLSVTLEVGEQIQKVEVTAATEKLVTTDSGAKTPIIGASEIQNLSTIGRSAVELLSLLPGVVNSGFNPLGGTSFGLGPDAFNVNGLRSDMNDVRLDNAHMIDPGCNCGNIIEPNMDMIQEFSVKASNFEADQGRSAMIMDTVLKSGHNRVHGEAYYYGRNAVLNANDWSNNLAGIPKPNSKFNYPGFNIGGPVRLPGSNFNKNNDKMFFFSAFEWQRQLADPGTELATVPTAKMRTGDFTELLNPKFCTQNSNGTWSGRYLNMPCQLTQPATAANPNTWGAPLLGNVLTASNGVTANGIAFLNYFPLPNFVDPNGRYNFAGRPLHPLNRNEQSVRVDYNLTDNTRMYLHLARNADYQYYPYGIWSSENSGWTSNIPEPSPTVGTNRGRSVVLNVVRIINPTLTNEFQFNVQALNLPNTYQDLKKWSKAATGFKFGGLTFNNPAQGINQGQVVTDTVPQITDAWDYYGGNPGAGRWGAGNLAGTVFADKTEFEWMDNLTKVKGTHTLKFGFAADRTRNDQNLGAPLEGRLITDTWGQGTSNEFGDILTEHFLGYEQASRDNDGLWRFWNVEWYGQDSWKARRRLTLNYGVRFSWMQPWYEARGLAVTFDPTVYNPSQPSNFLNGLLLATKGQIPNGVFPNPKPIPQPRITFAYDLFGTGKTVIRGGLGTFVQRDQGNISFNQSNAPPFSFDSSPGSNVAGAGPGYVTLSQATSTDPFGGLGNIDIQAANRLDRSQPQAYEWSFTVSQSVGLRTVLETSYVGNVSRHLFNRHNINVVQPGAMFVPGTTNCCKNGDSTSEDFRPYKPWGRVQWSDHSQTSNYNSLQVTTRRNVSQGLTLLTSYTWSKTLGFAENFQGGTDPFDTRRNYGHLPWDRRHLFNFSYIYQLPSVGAKHFGNNLYAKGVLDGWQLSGVTHYASGDPLRISMRSVNCVPQSLCKSVGKFSGGGQSWFGTPDIALTPLILFNPQQGVTQRGSVGQLWFNPTSATLPGIGQFGTFEQPTFRGPGSNNWDVTLFKKFPLGESRRLEFRIAAFDIFNRAQLDDPQLSGVFNWVLPAGATNFNQGTPQLINGGPGCTGSCPFGKILNKRGHREMLAAIKFYF